MAKENNKAKSKKSSKKLKRIKKPLKETFQSQSNLEVSTHIQEAVSESKFLILPPQRALEVTTFQNKQLLLELPKSPLKAVFKKVSILLLFIASITIILLVLSLISDNRIYPRIKAGNLDIGYTKLNQATEKLSTEIDSYLNKPFIFNYEGKTISLSSKDIGIGFNLDQTLKALPVFNFNNPDPINFINALITEQKFTFQHSINREQTLNILEDKLQLDAEKAKNAKYILKDKALEIESEMNGLVIDSNNLFAQLNINIDNLDNSPIELLSQPDYPTVTTADLNEQRSRLMGLMEKTITIFKDSKKLLFKPFDHLDAVEFSLDKQILIKINPSKIDSFLVENLFKDLEVNTQPVSISTDSNGKIIIDGKGEDGKFVPREEFYKMLSQVINNAEEKIEVPIEIEKAPVTISDDLQNLGIKEQLATGYTTYFGSSTNRMFNIDLGITKFNGLLIKPGEEFSFNQNLGQVDGKTGYRLEKVIIGNKAEYEYGGGICQVSTTLYRAILFAGLPVVDRRPHTWKISYYAQVLGDGLDATIYLGGQDLKFRNDTPGSLLIQSYTDGPRAYFKFYGTSDGRSVKMEGPIGKGLVYKWIRHIFDKDGIETQTETINSRYTPMPVAQPTPAVTIITDPSIEHAA